MKINEMEVKTTQLEIDRILNSVISICFTERNDLPAVVFYLNDHFICYHVPKANSFSDKLLNLDEI